MAAELTASARLRAVSADGLPTGVLTFLLTDVERSSALWEANPKTMARVLPRLDETFHAIAAQHGGAVVKSKGEGDSAFLVFPSPVGAIEAAVRLQVAVGEIGEGENLSLHLRMGLHTGEAELRGDDYLGVVVNRAARLRSLAEGGQIFLSQVTASLAQDDLPDGVCFRDLGVHHLRNMQRSERVFQLVHPHLPDVASSPKASRHTRRPLYGRATELERLQDAVAALFERRGRIVLISGEAGSGKTRLVGEVAEGAADLDVRVAWGRSWGDEGAPPYWPWVQILREIVRDLRPAELERHAGPSASLIAHMVPELAETLQTGEPLSPAGDSFELLDAVTGFLRSVATDKPLLLILDDLHVADDDSLRLLDLLVKSIASSRILVIATFGPDEISSPGRMHHVFWREAEHIHLTPLGRESMARLYRELTGRDATEKILEVLEAATEGNALLAGEAVGILAGGGELRRPDHSLGFHVPEGAKSILKRRLNPLPVEAQDILGVASVIGREFEIATLEDTWGKDAATVLDALDHAVRAGVIREVSSLGRYAFRHVLLRELVYEELPAARRMRLHRAVADVLEARYGDDEGHFAEIGHHLFKAAQAADKTKAFRYAVKAAEHARSLGAKEEAARLYSRALRLADHARLPADEREALENALAEVRR